MIARRLDLAQRLASGGSPLICPRRFLDLERTHCASGGGPWPGKMT